MRQRPQRGEKHKLADGTEVTVLDTIVKDMVKVLMPDGKLKAIDKNQISLQIIDTKLFEKV